MKAFPSVHDPKTGTMQLGMDFRDRAAIEFAKELMSRISYSMDAETKKSVCKQAYVWADALEEARDA